MNISPLHQTPSTASLSNRIDTLKDTVIPFFNRLSNLADAANAKLKVLAWLSLASACWLSYFSYWLLDLSREKLLPIAFAFSIPALFIWKLYTTLANVIALPSKLTSMGDSLKQVAHQFQNDAKTGLSNFNAQQHTASKLKDLILAVRALSGQGKLMAELSKQFAKAGKQEIIEAVITVASPQFAILMAIATIGTAISAFCSVLAGIAYLVFS